MNKINKLTKVEWWNEEKEWRAIGNNRKKIKSGWSKTHFCLSGKSHKTVCGLKIPKHPNRHFEGVYNGVFIGLESVDCENCLGLSRRK
jgi:hypothetical protein